MAKELINIKTHKIGCFPLLSIKYDGLNDIYFLFNKIIIFYEEITLKSWAPDKDIYPHTNVLFKPSSDDIINCVLNKDLKEVSACL